MKMMWGSTSFVLAISVLCLFSTPMRMPAGQFTVSYHTRENYRPDLARKYLDADLALIADVTSCAHTTISKSDSGNQGGLIYHRWTFVIVYSATVDSVLKGEYHDSTVTFQTEPITQQSTSRPVSPSDSLRRVALLIDNIGQALPRIHRVGRYLLLLRKGDDVYVCSYTSEPSKSRLEVFAEAEAKGEDYFESMPPTPVERYQAQQEIPRPEFVLRELTQAYNGRDAKAIDSLLTANFMFVPAHEEADKEGTEEYWGKSEFISFNESLFDPEFTSESGFHGAESISPEFVLISKRPIDVPDSNHWELTCDVRWLIFNSRLKPKPFGALYRGTACLTIVPDPLNDGSWLIREWREASAEVRHLYK